MSGVKVSRLPHGVATCTSGGVRWSVGAHAPTGRRTIGSSVRVRKSNDFLPAAGGENLGGYSLCTILYGLSFGFMPSCEPFFARTLLHGLCRASPQVVNSPQKHLSTPHTLCPAVRVALLQTLCAGAIERDTHKVYERKSEGAGFSEASGERGWQSGSREHCALRDRTLSLRGAAAGVSDAAAAAARLSL